MQGAVVVTRDRVLTDEFLAVASCHRSGRQVGLYQPVLGVSDSRWVLMEETQYRLNRIRDEMDYYLVTTSAADLDRDRLRRFFTDQQDIWNDVSRRWIEFRKLDQSQPGGPAPDASTP